MKKTLFLSLFAVAAAAASAQSVETPSLCDNWSIGLQGGVTTPMVNHPFFGSMRGAFGANINKQITPIFGMGVEALATVNTSSWSGMRSKTAIDGSYVGAYGKVNLMNLFGGYQCEVRPFTIDAIAGVGWGHMYFTKKEGPDHNFLATKVGLNFNYNVNPSLTLSLQPSIAWDMTDNQVAQTSAAYDARKAAFNLLAGVTYNIGGNGFKCTEPFDVAAIDALNAEVNAMRGQLANAEANASAWQDRAAALGVALEACQSQPTVVETTEVITENYLNSVRYVFFKIGSSVITPDQMPNVEMIASYLKNNPEATVVIKGYASKDGPEEVNLRLANSRAESVKNALIKKYGVNPSRISAEGEGIGNMFKEESWNRVSICTIQD